MAVVIGASMNTRLPSMRVMTRSGRVSREPGVQGLSSKFIPRMSIQAWVRRAEDDDGVSDGKIARAIDGESCARRPGTYLSMMFLRRAADRAARTRAAMLTSVYWRGSVARSRVPVSDAPSPRSTTPLALMLNVLLS